MYIELEYVKTNFPLWEQFCINENNIPDEDILKNQIALAENKLQQYIGLEPTDVLPNWLQLYLFFIVRYFCMELRHGDTEFVHKPYIAKDYENTILELQNLINGSGNTGGSGPVALSLLLKRITANADANKIKVTAKQRLFSPGGGFTGYEEVST